MPPHAGSPVQTIRSDKGCCSGVFPNSALPQGPSFDCDRPSFAANNRHFPSVQKPAFLHRAQCCRTRPVSVTRLHLEPGLIRQPTLSRSRCEPDRRRSELRLQGPADWRLSEIFYNHQTNLCVYLLPIRPRPLSCSGKRASSGKRAFKKPTQTAPALAAALAKVQRAARTTAAGRPCRACPAYAGKMFCRDMAADRTDRQACPHRASRKAARDLTCPASRHRHDTQSTTSSASRKPGLPLQLHLHYCLRIEGIY